MARDDNRARDDRSRSEPGGSSFGHVLLSDASRVCEATAVGTGAKFRHRIGGTAATDDRPPDPTAEAALVGALQEFEGAVRLVPRDHDAAKMLHHVRARLNRRSAREREVLHAKGSSLLIATVVVTNSSTGCRSGSPAPRGRSSASSTGRTAVKASSETRC